MTSSQVVAAYEKTGRRFEAEGIESFVLEAGSGEPEVCIHGVPASAYLYRKLVPELAQRGLRGIAFDLPRLGLADRPEDFDYSWTGRGRFARAAVDALELDRFHLVVHRSRLPQDAEQARLPRSPSSPRQCRRTDSRLRGELGRSERAGRTVPRPTRC